MGNEKNVMREEDIREGNTRVGNKSEQCKRDIIKQLGGSGPRLTGMIIEKICFQLSI